MAGLSKGAAGPGPDSTTSASAAAASWLVRSACRSRRQQDLGGATAGFLAAVHNKGELHRCLFDNLLLYSVQSHVWATCKASSVQPPSR